MASLFERYSGKILPPLADGQHAATLKSHEFCTTEGAEPLPYVKLVWNLSDRTLTDNRFEQSFGVFLSQLTKQMSITEAVDTQAYLNQLIANKTPVSLYISRGSYIAKATGEVKEALNINLIPPRETASASTDATPFG